MLVDHEIIRLICNTQCVYPVDFKNVQSNSLDVFLGKTLQVESEKGFDRVVLDKPFYLCPNAFCLGHTIEIFNLPSNITATFLLTSGGARKALAHSIAINIAPGFKGAITLELKNYSQFHAIELYEGKKIGQVIFEQHSHCTNPYNGKFNNYDTVYV